MLNLPIEVIGLIGYLSVAVIPHVAIAVWEGWTESEFDRGEWGAMLIASLLWPVVMPVAILMIAAHVAGRVIRAAARLARAIIGEVHSHDR